MARLVVVMAAAVLLASSCYCATVTVRPGDMSGWDVTVNRNGLAYFTSGGMVLSETTGGFPSGKGAFYALCTAGGQSSSDKTPDTVWLGLGDYNGQPLSNVTLNQIKTLRYTAYVSDMPTYQVKEGEWKYPREPITL